MRPASAVRLSATGLRHRYPGGPEILRGLSLAAEGGQLVAILGPSGSGKSTWLKTIAAQVRPMAGSIELQGPAETCTYGSASWRREVALVPQNHALLPRLTAEENVACGRLGHVGVFRGVLGWLRPIDRDVVRGALDAVGLTGFERRRADALSGGQQQRVAIARALAQEPSVLLADEPVASLDPGTARSVLDLFRELAVARGMAAVVSLHNPPLARACCDEIVGIRDGVAVFQGPAAELDETRCATLYDGGEA